MDLWHCTEPECEGIEWKDPPGVPLLELPDARQERSGAQPVQRPHRRKTWGPVPSERLRGRVVTTTPQPEPTTDCTGGRPAMTIHHDHRGPPQNLGEGL